MILPTRNNANLCVESTLNNIVKKLTNICDGELSSPPAKRIKAILNNTPLQNVFRNQDELVLAQLGFDNNLLLNIERDNNAMKLFHSHVEVHDNLDHLNIYYYFVANSASLATQNLDLDIPENAYELYNSIGHQLLIGDDIIYIFKLKKQSKEKLIINELFDYPEQERDSCAYDYFHNGIWEAMLNTLMSTFHLAFNHNVEIHTSPDTLKANAALVKKELHNSFSTSLSKNKILNTIARELGFDNGFTAMKNHQKKHASVNFDIKGLNNTLKIIERESRTLLELSHDARHIFTSLHLVLTEACYFHLDNPLSNRVSIKELEYNAKDTERVNYAACLALYCASLSEFTLENERVMRLTKSLTEYNRQIFALQESFII